MTHMMVDMIYIAVSVISQLAAAFFAIKLIRITGKHWAWIAISVSLIFMAVRRVIAFYFVISGSHFVFHVNELIGLLLSIIMLFGIVGIASIFDSIKESETKFSTIVNTAIDWRYWIRPNGELLYVSPSCKEITGYSNDEFVANPKLIQDIVYPEDKPIVERHFSNLDTEECSGMDFRIVTKSGEVRWIGHSCWSIYDDSGKWLGRSASNRDTTMQKRLYNDLLDGKMLNESIVDTTIDGVLVVDSNGKVIVSNKRFIEIWKIPQEVLDSNDGSEYAKYSTRNLKNPRKFLQEVQDLYINRNKKSQDEVEFKDGRVLDRYSSPLFDASGKYRGRVWFFRDITEKKSEERALEREVEFEKLVGQVARNLAEASIANIDDGIKEALSKVGDFIGFDRANVFMISEDGKTKKCIYDWQGDGVEQFFQCPREYPRDFFQALEKTLRRDRFVYIEDVNKLNDDWAKEKELWVEGNVKSNVCVSLGSQNQYSGHVCFEYVVASNKSYKESDGNLLKTFGEIIAVTLERKRIEENLERIAKFDTLTSLPNRYQFGVITDQMIAYSVRHGLVLAVLSMDIDNFKNINDTYGHMVGDMLLKAVGERCRANIRAEDFVARMGGDEFIVVAFGLKDVLEAENIAKKLIEVVQREYKLDGHTMIVTTSIGIACYPTDGLDKETLLKNADIAMYQAKEAGRNNYQFFTKELQMKRQGQLELENEMQVALSKKEFFLVYQPQFDENKRVIGMEALLRWQHPTKGLLLPGGYITIAEDSGFIVPLGKWVLEMAAKQFNEWQHMGIVGQMRMSVNLSFRQIEKAALEICDNFVEIVKEYNGSNGDFELELTETALMKRPEKSREVLQGLHDKGFDLAIDDFGTGYSSLQYLKYLPIQRVKIDQSFIAGIGVRKEDEIIVDAAIALAGKLDFKVLAEGVETEEQFDFLKKHECKQFQGYYFSYPLEAAAMLELLKKNAEKYLAGSVKE
ncbi:MAG: Diguanylate cyclase/phosphodiesterase with PAS/PAC and GAF sensor(S) [uncultured bacterium]|nr:MAG: Diguanylate cyclase/phosphodiesterase with PAS/PAC and GAF sensor(S) [uncultured bacterium]